MTIHYHGVPITPTEALLSCAGGNFCVSYAHPEQVHTCHKIGQSVMLDNGAYTFWRRGTEADDAHWRGYFEWCEQFIDCPTTWAIVPDTIDGELSDNQRMIRMWPHGQKFGAVVWHMHEPIGHLLWLIDKGWNRVCVGSSGQFANVGDRDWSHRMDHVFDTLIQSHRLRGLWVHMLRGMSLAYGVYPFASLDSTNVAQNHSRRRSNGTMQNRNAGSKMRALDAQQCPMRWTRHPKQMTI